MAVITQRTLADARRLFPFALDTFVPNGMANASPAEWEAQIRHYLSVTPGGIPGALEDMPPGLLAFLVFSSMGAAAIGEAWRVGNYSAVSQIALAAKEAAEEAGGVAA